MMNTTVDELTDENLRVLEAAGELAAVLEDRTEFDSVFDEVDTVAGRANPEAATVSISDVDVDFDSVDSLPAGVVRRYLSIDRASTINHHIRRLEDAGLITSGHVDESSHGYSTAPKSVGFTPTGRDLVVGGELPDPLTSEPQDEEVIEARVNSLREELEAVEGRLGVSVDSQGGVEQVVSADPADMMDGLEDDAAVLRRVDLLEVRADMASAKLDVVLEALQEEGVVEPGAWQEGFKQRRDN